MSLRAVARPDTEPAVARFASTRRLEMAEHLRLPYRVQEARAVAADGWTHRLTAVGGGHLMWPREGHFSRPSSLVTLRLRDGLEIPLCARLAGDDLVHARLGATASRWAVAATLHDRAGRAVAAVRRRSDGSVLLPFDPDEVLSNFWSESYATVHERGGRGRRARALLHTYYAVRDLVPRRAQIWLRQRYAPIQARRAFPRWPVEPSLHDLLELLLAMLADVAGGPVPYLSPWPHGYDWALVLTHDVETQVGLDAIEPVLAVERGLGLRSAWNFVPRRYRVDEARLRALQRAGFEVGVHGLYHDGRDLSSRARLAERLAAMRETAERWGAVGFRSPAMHRHWDWMPLLGFDYDSSYPDTDPYEPQPGGCLSWWPLFNRELVELPVTMPQDHTLFAILGHRDESLWVRKAEVLRRRGGMALVLTHPDYLTEPRLLGAYRRLLELYASDASAWKALPSEVSAWWRRRAATEIVVEDGRLALSGPAAEEAGLRLAAGWQWC